MLLKVRHSTRAASHALRFCRTLRSWISMAFYRADQTDWRVKTAEWGAVCQQLCTIVLEFASRIEISLKVQNESEWNNRCSFPSPQSASISLVTGGRLSSHQRSFRKMTLAVVSYRFDIKKLSEDRYSIGKFLDSHDQRFSDLSSFSAFTPTMA